MVTVMRLQHAPEVARIHESVLTDSIYTWIGRPFLEYYYRRLLENDQFVGFVHTAEGRVTGFLAATSASQGVFWTQIRRDAPAIAAVALRTIARDPRKLGLWLSASRFVFSQHRRLLPQADGEILSFAVLPEYRTSEAGRDGQLRPTAFYAKSGIPVAAELFATAVRHLAERGVRELKIMTSAENAASNRFYAKTGCLRLPQTVSVFGHPTALYHGRLADILARMDAVSATSCAIN